MTQTVLEAAAAPKTQPRRRRNPITWVQRGGLSTLLFLLPLLLIFGVFSWTPIVEAVVMSFQKTNLVTAGGLRRLGQLRRGVP